MPSSRFACAECPRRRRAGSAAVPLDSPLPAPAFGPSPPPGPRGDGTTPVPSAAAAAGPAGLAAAAELVQQPQPAKRAAATTGEEIRNEILSAGNRQIAEILIMAAAARYPSEQFSELSDRLPAKVSQSHRVPCMQPTSAEAA